MEQMIFASKLKELRKRQGMSQEQLAEAVGLSVQAVSKWECALSWPDITLLPVISQLFGVSIDHLLSNHIAENTHGPAFTAETFPFADDGVLRIVQYKGRKIMQQKEYSPDLEIPLAWGEKDCAAQEVRVEIWGSANIRGNVQGNVEAGAHIVCADVRGDVSANGSVQCRDIDGDVSANGCISCQQIDGDVDANGGVSCTDVQGDICSSGSVTCQTVGGDIEAGRDIHISGCLQRCGDIEGNLIIHLTCADTLNLTCGDVDGNVSTAWSGDEPGACGQADGRLHRVACGHVDGDVRGVFEVHCENVEGSVDTPGTVYCGNVEGDVHSRGNITCGNVEGDIKSSSCNM